MKRITALFIAIIMLFSLSACGSKSQASTTSQATDAEIDAIKLSLADADGHYAMRPLPYAEDLWILDFVCFNECVFYIASNNQDKYELCCLTPNENKRDILCVYDANSTKPISITVSETGQIYVLATVASTENGFDGNSEEVILEYSQDGIEQKRYTLSGFDMPTEWIPHDIEVAGDRIFLSGYGAVVSVLLSGDTSVSFVIETKGNALITALSDGSLAVGENKNEKFTISVLEKDKQEFSYSKTFNIPFVRINRGENWDLYLDDGNNLYGFNLNTNSMQKLISWSSLGVYSGKVMEQKDGTLLCCGRLNLSEPSPMLLLSQSEGNSENAQKPSGPIVLATLSRQDIPFSMQQAIREWNQTHPDTPIEIRDYSVYYSDSDQRAAELKLSTDIITGNYPDIYDFSIPWQGSSLSSTVFMRRGLLENLYPYIDKDQELSRSDFFPGILSSLEIDNGLYELVLEYRFLTSFAVKSDVGEADQWSYDHFNSIVNDSGFYESMLDQYQSRYAWLQTAIDSSGSRLVNWNSCTCYFDSDYFVDMLNAAIQLPEQGDEYGASVVSEIRNSASLLYYMDMDSIWWASTAAQVYGDNFALVGMPEVGNAIRPTYSFGISAYSQHKDECWEFLRQFIVGEKANEFEFSMRQDVMRSKVARNLEQAVTGGYADKHPYAEMAMNEVFDNLVNMENVARHDEQIWDIVYSEVGAFFANQRSAEETASAIQRRASIYLAEQG